MSESGVNFGSWKMIGYTMNTTNKVFTYDSSTTTTTSGTGVLDATQKPVWRATPQAALNDCTTSNYWQLKISKATGTNSNGAVYDAEVSGGAGGNCDVLVPGFGKLDQSGVVDQAP